ncbi:hypothetical protein [Micromonospora sp. WMMD1155]|uniref:hypothetical protein n=1 Tax=Micromonospora sp. WMMD1155 TaxID=3016094 RepID=UPI00249B551A|nr:hypothetical protein [Micromonospora sp. WMMD1155]WFE51044.1 hypothetical protein O7617_12210 [Micromonospora sp. WMMD1155]
MSYRDWGRGDGSPRERPPTASWSERAASLPVDPYDEEGRYRTSSRRRALDRGQDEPVDAYLPRWALESGVRHADGGGRHAAPDEDDREIPTSGAGRRSTEASSSRRRRGTETGWREQAAIGAAPDSDHTREWTLDRPQEQGYAGRRRADAEEDEPVSGAVRERRPRRASTARPQVIWSGGDVESTPSEPPAPEPEVKRPTRRSRRAAEESWTRPPADPWARGADRPAEPEPSYPPAVDPWDASGVHAWPSAAGTDLSEQWSAVESVGGWERSDRTGQWERSAIEDDQWDQTLAPRSDRSVAAEGWPARDEGFWPGTRLADDDPRWMDPTTSAPRSPVVGYTAPRPRSAPVPSGGAPRRRADRPPVGAASVRRRVESAASGAFSRRLEDDLLDPDPGGSVRPLLYTAACYLVPAMLIFVWLLTLDGQAPAGCVTDISGGGCDSARSRALESLLAGSPRFGLALVSSLVVAALLRRVGTTWRSATIAVAAAVVGGGLSTVLISAVTGQPIG